MGICLDKFHLDKLPVEDDDNFNHIISSSESDPEEHILNGEQITENYSINQPDMSIQLAPWEIVTTKNISTQVVNDQNVCQSSSIELKVDSESKSSFQVPAQMNCKSKIHLYQINSQILEHLVNKANYEKSNGS